MKLFSDGPERGASVRMAEASFPFPFQSGVEFNVPSRGKWNIVHQGMLLPGAHQIYLCARGCLRGVIMTAAEMNALDRISWVAFSEDDVSLGRLEQVAIDGILNILGRMKSLPSSILLFNSCVHRFTGFDYEMVREGVAERYPDLPLVECFMNPTMRKTDMPEDQLLKRQIYSAVAKAPVLEEKAVNIIGNDRPTAEGSELMRMLTRAGYIVRDISQSRSFAEFQEHGRSLWNICYLPEGMVAAKTLSERLGQKCLYKPLSYDMDEIERDLRDIARELGTACSELDADILRGRERATQALTSLRSRIGDMPVSIDYTATPRPLSLARMLLNTGINVTRVYADAVIVEEKGDFEWLKANAPDLLFCSTLHPTLRLRRLAQPQGDGPMLAVGQKAAFLTGTPHFVNIVSCGGWIGFDGIRLMAEAMLDAADERKDTRTLIQFKGLGCESCLS